MLHLSWLFFFGFTFTQRLNLFLVRLISQFIRNLSEIVWNVRTLIRITYIFSLSSHVYLFVSSSILSFVLILRFVSVFPPCPHSPFLIISLAFLLRFFPASGASHSSLHASLYSFSTLLSCSSSSCIRCAHMNTLPSSRSSSCTLTNSRSLHFQI